MKTKAKYLLGASILFLLAGCSSKEGVDFNADCSEPFDASSKGESVTGDYYSPSSYDSEPTSNKNNNQTQEEYNLPAAGQITCSAVNDNNDYNYWSELCSINSYAGQNTYGEFVKYTGSYDFKTANRLELNVINGNNVKVTIKDTQYQTYVDNFHKAYLFPNQKQNNYDVEISYLDSNDQKQTITKNVKDGDIVDLEQTFTTSKKLQVMFVIDATGSMTDEIRYLQAEIDNIITRVKEDNETAHIELAIMMYRDVVDDYVLRYSDFSTDVNAQKAFLAEQEANGGGDYEEAVDEAMNAAIQKQWDEDATKLLIHVADAPSHDRDVPRWNNAVLNAASKGIKIISVGCSGIQKYVEYMFRCQSLITGGQYVFLTDDSKIGNSHVVASTEHPITVEFLNSCLIRLVNGYFKGVMTNPTPYFQEAKA